MCCDYACEAAILFLNPDAKAIECAGEIMKLRINEIKEGKAKKHKYIPVKDRE